MISKKFQVNIPKTSGLQDADELPTLDQEVKDVVKLEKVTITPTSDFEDFSLAILERIGTPPILEVNAKLVIGDLLDRAREEKEKRVKIHPQLVTDLVDLLGISNEITRKNGLRKMKQVVKSGIA